MPGYNISASLASSNTVGVNNKTGQKVFNNGIPPWVLAAVAGLALVAFIVSRK